ncbi:intermembrane transport protein PqiB [Stenotrophobium rhamnosiphilum]|uniref:Mammalian cell entry protein n=1 Tax=Stenotrophobium rhamnosiphilum TaxID=2029166 RepID=A0A2T5MBY1_9GAMM|nr:MlaD family protein [Stenotrophobium rhamnosiphilum]PTU30086.1 mammalian cell entry protein [Stenotrophobium rhamnosiphilum]
MSTPESPDYARKLPTPEVKPPRRGSLSLIWLVPLVAALAGLVLVVRGVLQSGPTITITFDSAEGLEADKTEVKYKDVVIGKVRNLALSSDRSHVVVTVDLSKNASSIAVDDTRFWVERPRVGLGGISGISTLLSGAYLGVDIGNSTNEQTEFVGLEKPPAIAHDLKGRRFMLHTTDASSLTVGSPAYFRKMPVGRITAAELDANGKGVTIQVFINAPYDKFVGTNTRFWNASGVDLTLNAAGLKVSTQSVATVLAGGIAFQAYSEDKPGEPAKENAEFTLFSDQMTALAPPDGIGIDIRMVFGQSTRGLTVGSPVDFRGITLGVVKSIQIDYDPNTRVFFTNVDAVVYPERMGPVYHTLLKAEQSLGLAPTDMVALLVGQGMRGQMRTGNLLTGQSYVSLDVIARAKPVKFDPDTRPLIIPTTPGNLEEVQAQIQNIARKLDAVPFDKIGNNLNDTLRSADSVFKQLDKDLAPQAKKMLEEAQRTLQSLDQNLVSPDAPLQQNAGRTLEQIDAASRSLRALADYLEKHPESLLRGKPVVAEPAAPKEAAP